jgi:hypothetical protein
VHSKKYSAIGQELRQSHEGLTEGGPADKLIHEISEMAAWNLAQLDRNPELRLGVQFLLLGTAKALASKRIVHGCLGRRVTPREERAIEECAVALARTASQIKTR